MNPLQQKSFVTDSATIHYWTNGNLGKPTVFLLHGAAMDHSMFDPQLEVLQSYNVIAWDARGHGASRPVRGNFALSDLANDALAILDSLNITSALFIGQSEGSMVAQEVYRLRPLVVNGLVSIGGSPIMLTYSKMDIWLLNLSTSIIKVWPYKNFMNALAKKTAIKKNVQEYALSTVASISKKDFLSIWSGVTSSLSTAGIMDMQITVPLLLTYGEHDTTGTVKKNNIRWHEYEPHARLVVIPDAGHNANQDNPSFFNELLAKFLNDISAK